MDSEVETLEVAMGRAVREVRAAEGITLDQLARAVREKGVKWSTARVVEFEKGQLRITLPMMLAVAQSLSELTGWEMSLRHLVSSGPPLIRITEEWLVRRSALSAVLGDEPVHLGSLVAVEGSWADFVSSARAGKVSEGVSATPASDLAADPLVPTLAEERAAKRLGTTSRDVAEWSSMLWGTHLDDEVTKRAGVSASPQARGHITRQLVEDVRAMLIKHHPGYIDPGPSEEDVDGDG